MIQTSHRIVGPAIFNGVNTDRKRAKAVTFRQIVKTRFPAQVFTPMIHFNFKPSRFLMFTTIPVFVNSFVNTL